MCPQNDVVAEESKDGEGVVVVVGGGGEEETINQLDFYSLMNCSRVSSFAKEICVITYPTAESLSLVSRT